MPENESGMKLKTGVALVGGVLLIFGVVQLLYMGIVIYQVVQDPGNVGLVKYMMSHLNLDDPAVRGAVSNTPFEMTLGRPVRFMLYIIIGILTLSVLASILRTIVSAGVKILSLALTDPDSAGGKQQKNRSRSQAAG